MKTYFAVTGVVMNNKQVLILKKKDDDYNYPGKWGFCSGYVKEFEAAEDTCIREIKEETGLVAEITKKAEIFQKDDEKLGKSWVIKVFLCKVDSREVILCHENSEFMWIGIDELKKYPLVPGLEKDLKVLDLI